MAKRSKNVVIDADEAPPEVLPVDPEELDGGQDTLVVVGIGASAGGLEALKLLLPNLPAKANLTYVIAQHLDPKHRSMLVGLLAGSTPMKVMEIKHGQEVSPGEIYLCPPGKNVTIAAGKLKLSNPTAPIGPKPSVDYFFTSLAEDKGENAVGIILSGTGSDGAGGIRALKAGGGITIVQDPATSKFNGMPQSAISTRHVDLVLPPEKIGLELIEITRHPRGNFLTLQEGEVPDDMHRILRMLLARTGADFADYKVNTLERRIKRRMAIHKLDTLPDYLAYLEKSANELDLLQQDILISVTAFFRDEEAFRSLESALKGLIESKNPGDDIRIWIAGCASGEEPYSIAILLDRLLGARKSEFHIQIFGTDLDEDAILRARKGIYPDSSIAEVDEAILERYFSRVESSFQVVKGIREMVVFAKQNMLKDPPFSRLDLISCRNVLIYFQARVQKRLLPMFHYVLNPGGYLFLGKSESIGEFADLFEPLNKRWKVFRRKGTLPSSQQGLQDYFPTTRYQPNMEAFKPEKAPTIKDLIHSAIMEVYSPCGVLIDERLQLRHVLGDVDPYLRLRPGDADLNIVNLARDELRLDVRTLVYKAARERLPLRSGRLRMPGKEGDRAINIHVRPLVQADPANGALLVLFEEDLLPSDVPAFTAEAGSEDPRLRELEEELAMTRERLQTTVEELETANEELQSLNEELQSANEELQSSNEELETANEELQSTNEELTTVNEELQVKSAELAAANTDMENILGSVGDPLLVVDKDLKVTRFTPQARKLFSLSSLDVGQVITTIPCRLALPTLRDDLLKVIDLEEPLERVIESNGVIYQMRVLPYFSEHQNSSGAVLVFHDQTRQLRTQEELHESEALLRAIFNNVLYGIVSITEHGIIETFNPTAEHIFGYSASEVAGLNVSALMPEPMRHQHDDHLTRYLRTGEGSIVGKTRLVEGLRKDGRRIALQLTVSESRVNGRRVFIGMCCEPGACTIVKSPAAS